MSCQQCHYITGHDPTCRHFHEDRAHEQDDLRSRVDDHESRIAQLEKLVGEHTHLKKLYTESRDYVRTLERERDELVDAAKLSVVEQDRLDALVERLRPVYDAAKIVRASLPASVAELRERRFHASIVDLAAAVERAIEVDFNAAFSPYRGAP